MVRSWFVIFSFGWLSLGAQTTPNDSVSRDFQQDSVELSGKKIFSFRLYWDIGKTAMIWTDFEEKTELGIELLWLERIQLIGEAGTGYLRPRDAFQNSTYTSEGQYARVGIGYLTNVDLRNKIGLGFRYGMASFDDRLDITIDPGSGLNDTYTESISRGSLTATWIEFVLNSEKYILINKRNPESAVNRLLSFGFLFRYRILIDYDRFAPVDVYAIPGYGRTLNKTVPAVNLFFKVNLF